MPGQTDGYTTQHDIGYPGTAASDAGLDVISRVASLTDMPVGLAAVRDAAGDGCKLPGAVGDKFLGIVYRSLEGAEDDGSNNLIFPLDSEVPIGEAGEFYVTAGEAVTVGDPVFVRYTAGTLGEFLMADPGTEAFVVTGATWELTAASGARSKIKIPAATNA